MFFVFFVCFFGIALLFCMYFLIGQQIKWQVILSIKWFLAYIVFVLYAIGKVFIRTLLPLMFLIFVSNYNIWNEIDSFRWFLLYFYIFCFLIIVLMTLDIMPISIYLFHIFPSKVLPQMPVKFGYVEWHYETINTSLFRESYLKDKFGNDVAKIIIEYVSRFHFVREEKEIQMKMYRQASLLGKW